VRQGPSDGWRLIPNEQFSIRELATAAEVYGKTIVEWVYRADAVEDCEREWYVGDRVRIRGPLDESVGDEER
jgi:hypothetical protein